MKKILLTVLGIIGFTGMFAYCCTLANRTEVMTCVSCEGNDIVSTFEDADGNLWEYNHYYAVVGDDYKVTMHDNDTINIYDDFIVKVVPVEE